MGSPPEAALGSSEQTVEVDTTGLPCEAGGVRKYIRAGINGLLMPYKLVHYNGNGI